MMYSHRNADSIARAAERQIEHAEQTNLELDRLTIALLAASHLLTQPREAIGAKIRRARDRDAQTSRGRAAFTRGSDRWTPQRSVRRFAVAAAALAVAAVAAARWRRQHAPYCYGAWRAV